MRHRVYGRKLGRTKNERISLFRNLMQELFLHGTITTSKAKAASIKGEVDKVINLAKNKTTQRLLQSFFSKNIQDRIVKEIAPKLANRNSGYTSLIKVGTRDGDRTALVKMSLIGLEELKPLEKKESPKKQDKVEKNLTVEKTKVALNKTTKPASKKAAATKKVTASKRKVSKK